MLKQYTGFDHENVLKPETPIRVTAKRSHWTKATVLTHQEDVLDSFYALILLSNPVAIRVLHVYNGAIIETTIRADEVQSGKYTIEPLVYEEVKWFA